MDEHYLYFAGIDGGGGGANASADAGLWAASRFIGVEPVTATTTAATFLKFGTAASAGTLIRSDVSYLRITNLDDTNFVTVGLQDDSADTAYIKLEKGQSVILGGTDEGPQVEVSTNASAFSAWASVDSLTLDADTASVDVEIFAAMT